MDPPTRVALCLTGPLAFTPNVQNEQALLVGLSDGRVTALSAGRRYAVDLSPRNSRHLRGCLRSDKTSGSPSDSRCVRRQDRCIAGRGNAPYGSRQRPVASHAPPCIVDATGDDVSKIFTATEQGAIQVFEAGNGDPAQTIGMGDTVTSCAPPTCWPRKELNCSRRTPNNLYCLSCTGGSPLWTAHIRGITDLTVAPLGDVPAIW